MRTQMSTNPKKSKGDRKLYNGDNMTKKKRVDNNMILHLVLPVENYSIVGKFIQLMKSSRTTCGKQDTVMTQTVLSAVSSSIVEAITQPIKNFIIICVKRMNVIDSEQDE